MSSAPSTCVSPCAFSPASVNAAPPRRSRAVTRAPYSSGTPRTTAVRPLHRMRAPHAVQVPRVGKSVLKHVFHNHARPLGHGQQRQHLYLHIRREAGIRLRLQLCKRCQTLRCSQNNAFFFLAHIAAHFAQLRIHRQQCLNRGAGQLNDAACNCPRRQQRSGDNAVGAWASIARRAGASRPQSS